MTALLPASGLSHPGARAAELRGWALGLRDLRRDAIELAVRGRSGVPGVPSGDRCFAVATGPGRWVVGLLDARGPGGDAAETGRALVAHLRQRAGDGDLRRLAADANAFVRRAAPGRLVAATLLLVDAARHAVRVVVAGGQPVRVVGRSGDVVALGDRGPALGLVEDARWREAGPVRLAPGHLLLAASDGVSDRARDDGTVFGDAGVAEILRALRADGPRAAVRGLLDAADAFSHDDPSDRTALALRIDG